MKVKCRHKFNDKWQGYLTIDKIYEVISEDNYSYWLFNDNEYYCRYPLYWFKLVK